MLRKTQKSECVQNEMAAKGQITPGAIMRTSVVSQDQFVSLRYSSAGSLSLKNFNLHI